MKKIFLVLAAIFCVATVSAQSKFESSVKNAANTIASQKWAIGLRAGYNAEFQAECFYADKAYLQGNVGLNYVGVGSKHGSSLGVNFTFLHNWNCCVWDWTPNAGQWFLDAGVGAGVGGNAHYVSFGVAGQVKFGIKFKKAPVRLAIDVTPVVGPWVDYNRYVETVKDDVTGESATVRVNGKNEWHYNTLSLGNVAISATYCF